MRRARTGLGEKRPYNAPMAMESPSNIDTTFVERGASGAPEPFITTRSHILIGAGVSFLCTPAVVRAASLMALRGIPLQRPQAPLERPQAGFCQRLMYAWLDRDLREGKMRTVLNGVIVPVADARRMVAYARANSWLPPTG